MSGNFTPEAMPIFQIFISDESRVIALHPGRRSSSDVDQV